MRWLSLLLSCGMGLVCGSGTEISVVMQIDQSVVIAFIQFCRSESGSLLVFPVYI